MSTHFLVVEPWDPDAGPADLIYVEHPADCPTLERAAGPHRSRVFLNCEVGFLADSVGLSWWFNHADDPQNHRAATRVPRGRHELEAWFVTRPYYNTEVHDSGLRLAAVSTSASPRPEPSRPTGERCGRCQRLHDPDAAGAAPEAGLCPICTANNDDRVLL